MVTTGSSEIEVGFGRVSAELLEHLRRKISSGQYVAGHYLPTLRELSESRGIARKTVLGVLRKLEAEGYICAEPRKGYRVQARASDPARGCPLAYLADLKSSPEEWRPFHQELLWALQGAATANDWTLMGVGSAGRSSDAILKQLTASRTSGLIVDALEKDVMESIRQAGMPAVAVDAWDGWDAKTPIDLIIQDSYQGGMLAAECLAARHQQRVAYLGPTTWSAHSLARVSGTAAGFLKHGHWLPPESIVACKRDDCASEARELLTRPNRPTGIVALYQEVATTLVAEARKLNLKLGRDLELVGWATEQQYQRDWLPLFRGEPSMPAVVWSPTRMAQLALERLETRRRNPQMPPVRILVPVELREGELNGGVR